MTGDTPFSWRRALVTGGAGFLGSHLCERLLDSGVEVDCADNLACGRRENIAHLEDRPGFRYTHCDVSEPDCAERLPGPYDLVLHFACPASPADYLRMPLETLDVGSLGTRNALAIAERDGARLLLASTSEVYGDPLVHPQHEGYWGNVNPVGPRSVYDESKRFAEALVTAHAATNGTDAGIVRLFNTYGPPHAGPRRPRGAHLHLPGPGRRTAHGDRRRQPDPFAVLRGRHGRRHPAGGREQVRTAGEHRRQRRDHHGGPGPPGGRADRLPVPDRLRRPTRRRPRPTPPRHDPRPRTARLVTAGPLGGGPEADDRLLRGPAPGTGRARGGTGPRS